MKERQVFGVALLALCTAIGTGVFAAQDKPQDKGAPTNKPAASGQKDSGQASAMQAKMKEFGTPGTAHKVFDGFVGRWTVDVKMFEPGSTTPMESKGSSDAKWIMGGRYLEETVRGEYMGQPFEGRCTMGYDNLKKSYVSAWIDNMSTAVMYGEGAYDPATKTFTWTGECPDVMAGKYTPSRSTMKMVDPDHWTAQAYKTGADGKEALMMQLDYTRAKP
jgi:hypothetical protein